MTVKNIIDVQVNDAEWNKFNASFEKHRDAVKKLPGAWGDTEKIVKSTGNLFLDMTAALLAGGELQKHNNKLHTDAEKTLTRSAKAVRTMSHDSRDIAQNMKSAAENILRMGKFGLGVMAGLVGGTGLATFGLDRLAGNASNYRRAGLGLGSSTGSIRAFQNSYSRFISPDAFLENINQIGGDRRLQYGLGGNVAGMQARGMDTAQIAAQILPQIVDQFVSRGGMGANGASAIQSLGLERFGLSLDDLRRLARSRGELASAQASFSANSGSLNTSDATGMAWQNFITKLDYAGQKIETVFINRLVKLEPGLEKLTDDVARFVDSAMSNPHIGKWIEDIGHGLEAAGTYLGSSSFTTDVHTFASGMEVLGQKGAALIRWFGGTPDATTAFPAGGSSRASHGASGSWVDDGRTNSGAIGPFDSQWGANSGGMSPSNNPLNLRPVSGGGFRQFDSQEDGIRAAYAQIQRDINVHHLATTRQLIGDETWGWAPASDHNDVAGYLRGIASTSVGTIGPDQRLNPNDTTQMSTLIAAMARQENGRSHITPAEVRVVIQNQTGGNAVISGNQVAQ